MGRSSERTEDLENGSIVEAVDTDFGDAGLLLSGGSSVHELLFLPYDEPGEAVHEP